MKKILPLTSLLFVSLLAAVVVSCKKESLDNTDPVFPSIVVSFNTGSLYEELGVKEEMAAELSAGGNFTIIDSLLVYDLQGALVTKLGVESNSFEEKKFELDDIPMGTYTLVLWQSAWRKSDGARAWKVSGEKSLSTAQISSGGLSFGFAWAVGTASATATRGTNSPKLTLTPKSIGSIVDVTVDNIPDDAGFTNLAMIGGKYHKGVYLDPSLQDDRWITEGTTGVLFRLYPDEGGKRKFFTLARGENLNLFIRGDKVGSYDDLGSCLHKTVATGKNYTFYFDVARRNWQPAYFGSAVDFTAWKADRDAGLLVIDPCLDWGCDLAHVEEYVRGKNWWKDADKVLYQIGPHWCRSFWVADKLKEEYRFETQNGQRFIAAVGYCDDTSIPVEVAYDMLQKKGFNYVGELYYADEPHAYRYYVSADKTLQAMINTTNYANWAVSIEPYYEEDSDQVLSAVDLGLSVKWCTRNLGADKPEDIGDFFAWGEVEPHYSSLNPLKWKAGKETGYDWKAYRWCDGTAIGYTKYFNPDYDGQGTCHWAGEGDPDGKMTLDPEDDAAHVILGGSWRMPTVEEVKELADTKKNENYKWEYKSLNGQEGMFVTYLVNGNYIFLPNTGIWSDAIHSSVNTELDDVYRQGYFWASTIPKVGPFYGYCLVAGDKSIAGRTASFRRDGLAIRPVTAE